MFLGDILKPIGDLCILYFCLTILLSVKNTSGGCVSKSSKVVRFSLLGFLQEISGLGREYLVTTRSVADGTTFESLFYGVELGCTVGGIIGS